MERDLPDPSLWTFCFAKGHVPVDFLQGSPIASNRGTYDIPMIYSVIETARPSGRGVILVDTGFASGQSMTGRKFADFEMPRETLGKIGLTPEDVDTIVLTHLHFDHAGNLDAFPNARIVVQRAEYEGWRRALDTLTDADSGKQNWIMSSMNPDDLPRFERAKSDGRVTFVDGRHELEPGVVLNLAADSHTFGSQWIDLETRSGRFVVAGDVVVTYANLERMWPPGYHQGNAWNLYACYRDLTALVDGDIRRIVVGHDMELFRRHESFTAGANPVAAIALSQARQADTRSTISSRSA